MIQDRNRDYWIAFPSDRTGNYDIFLKKLSEDSDGDECTDSDGDGFAVEGGSCGFKDCDDNDASINPGETEVCNGVDDDCDGQTDEGFTDESRQYICQNNGYVWTNNGSNPNGCGNDTNEGSPYEAIETSCDDIDNDCDGTVDEGCDGGEAILSVSPSSIDFGETETTVNISISNSGSGTLKWNASDDVAWLTLAPISGQVTTGTDTVIATCNRSGEETGTHTATITITGNGGTKTILVLMTVTEIIADFEGCTDINAPDYVQFYDMSSGDVGAWEWIFGDGGSPSYEQNPVHEYQEEG